MTIESEEKEMLKQAQEHFADEMVKRAQEHWAPALMAAKQRVIAFFILDDADKRDQAFGFAEDVMFLMQLSRLVFADQVQSEGSNK